MKPPLPATKPTDPACQPGDHTGAHAPRGARVPRAAFERAAAMFGAAGDVARLRLLEELSHGERCVTELATTLAEGLSTISQRLRLLRAAGLVRRRRAGIHIFYRLADEHVAALIANTLAHARERDSADDAEGDEP